MKKILSWIEEMKKNGSWPTVKKVSFAVAACAVFGFIFWELRFNGITLTPLFGGEQTEQVQNENAGLQDEIQKTANEAKNTADAAEQISQEADHVQKEPDLSNQTESGQEPGKKQIGDITKDSEVPTVWEQTIPELSGNPRQDLVNTALSQIGYQESVLNFESDENEDGTYSKRGYTRYGQWAGSPYLDNWSAVFASFCLYYAGIEDAAALSNSGAQTMMTEWENHGYFIKGTDEAPEPGDLVFLDKINNGRADAVAIVVSTNKNFFTAVEGNEDDSVKEVTYADSDSQILGYGRLPETEQEKEAENRQEEETVTEAAQPADETAAKESVQKTEELEIQAETKTEQEEASGKILTKEEADKIVFTNGTSSYVKGGWFSFLQKAAPKEITPDANGNLDLTDYLKTVTGEGTTYTPPFYSTKMNANFNLSAEAASLVTTATGKKLYWNLPKGVILGDNLIAGGTNTAFKEGTNEIAFYYSFHKNEDGTYRVDIQFRPEYVEDAQGSDISNGIRFECLINEKDAGSDNGVDLEISKELHLVIPNDQINWSKDISVEKEMVHLTNDQKLAYTVKVSSANGTPGPIELTDTLTKQSEDGILGDPLLTSVVKYSSNKPVEECSPEYRFEKKSNSQFVIHMNLDPLEAGEYYLINYEYPLEAMPQNADRYINNNVSVSSSDGKNKVEDNAFSGIWEGKKPMLEKAEIVSGDEVSWTVTLNKPKFDIADMVFKDPMLNEANKGLNITYEGRGEWEQIPAVENVDYIILKNENDEIEGIQFLPETDTGTNTKTYQIKYQTKGEAEYGKDTIVKNRAEFDGESVEKEATVKGGSLYKKSDGFSQTTDGKYAINWSATINIPTLGIKEGTVFTDTFSPDGHYMTEAQWKDFEKNLKAAWGENAVHNITPVTDSSDKEKIIGYSFETGPDTLKGKAPLTIVWKYQTTAEAAGTQPIKFKNALSDGKKDVEASQEIDPSTEKVKKLSFSSGGWTEYQGTAELNSDGTTEFGWVIEITTSPNVTTYTLKDQLPVGVEAVKVGLFEQKPQGNMPPADNFSVSIPADGNSFSKDMGWSEWNLTNINGTYDRQDIGDKLTINIEKSRNSNGGSLLTNEKLYVYVGCSLKENAWPKPGQTSTETYTNKVNILADKQDYGHAENDISVTAKKEKHTLNKTGTWNQEKQTVNYVVEINPAEEDLVPESDSVNFKDTLTYTAKKGVQTGKAVLLLDSVKLEKKVNGKWVLVDNVSWNAYTNIIKHSNDDWEGQSIIQMQVPDSTHLKLSYSYLIDSTLDQGMNLKNTATMNGQSYDKGQDNIDIPKKDFSHSAESSYRVFHLQKVDTDTGKGLKGAKFTVQGYINGKWTDIGKEYLTDSDGSLNIQYGDKKSSGEKAYEYNIAYRIQETQAPAGYQLPENPSVFYFWFSQGQTEPSDKPSDFPSNAADISVGSYRATAANQRSEEVVLPETGGNGMEMFLFTGALAAGISLFLISRKTRTGLN